MKQLLIAAFSILSYTAVAQTVFFSSPKIFNDEQLKTFYASVTIKDNLLLFNAPDYTLYAYDKSTGTEKWNYYMQWKSNQAPFIVGSNIWTRSGDEFVQLDSATGEKTKTFPFGTIETEPVVKDGIVYLTAISGDGGCVMAYEPQQDSVLWSRFLAHGCQQKPYYLSDKIVANAEGTNWIELNYNGRLKDAACDTVAYQYPSELPCARQFFALSHDGLPITGKAATALGLDDYTTPDIFTGSKHSFILNEDRLTVFGNKLKKKAALDLSQIEFAEEHTTAYAKIIAANDAQVWIVYNNHLVIYDHQKKRVDKTVDLSLWQPHQVLADQNNLWIVSRKDGRLYGVTIP